MKVINVTSDVKRNRDIRHGISYMN